MKRSPQRGMTLLEVMMALAIVMMSFAGLFVMLDGSTRTMDSNRRALDAALVAESAIERLRAGSWTDLTNKPERYELDQRSYVAMQSNSGMTATVECEAFQGYKEEPLARHVAVLVSWREMDGHIRTNVLSTVISPWSMAR